MVIKMKKKLSITAAVTAVALLIGQAVYAAQYTDLKESDECYTDASRLYDFGIMGGYDDGSFRPDNEITRAEVARLLASVMNIEERMDSRYEWDEIFSDVPEEHWASHYIYFLVSEGAISGYDDGTFRPENTITYEELSKILVCLPGYRFYAEKEGGYPSGYMMYAASLGITKDLAFNNTDNVTRAHAAMMISKTLDVPLMVIVGYDFTSGIAFPVLEMQDGDDGNYQTLLTHFHQIYTVNASKE